VEEFALFPFSFAGMVLNSKRKCPAFGGTLSERLKNRHRKMEREKKNLIVLFLLICTSCFLAYFNTLTNPFIWDDEGLILKNSLIKDWHYWRKAFTSDLYFGSSSGSNFYRPIQTLSYIWDYFFWQLNPLGYHITNIFLQIIVSFLVFLLLYSLCGNLIVSYSTALLFAVSPLHTEAVSYISGRSDLLLGVFIVSALLAFINSQRGGSEKCRKIYFYLSLWFFILALLSKELAAIFPFVIFSFALCCQRGDLKKRRFFIINILPFFIIDILYFVLRLSFVHFTAVRPPELAKYPLSLRILVLPKVIFSYFKLLLLPLDLHMSRTFQIPASFWPLLWLWVLLVLILLLLMRLFRRWPEYNTASFLSLWFSLFLLPQSGLLSINAFIAEHFIYLSSISFFALVAYIFLRYLRRLIFFFSLGGLVFFYILLTISRNAEWKYPVVFYERIIELSPLSFMAHNNLGLEYQRRHQYDQAIAEYKEALSISPNLLEAHSNLANLYYETKRFKEAEREYAIIEKIAPRSKAGEVANNVAALYEAEGLFEQAINKYNLALRIDPNLRFTHFNLARIYLVKGELNLASEEIIESMPKLTIPSGRRESYIKAIAVYLKTTEKQKSAPAFYNDLGVNFASSRMFDAAIESFKSALELMPGYQDAHFNLALAYYKSGLKDKAISELRLMLKIKPSYKKAQGLLESILLNK
jgi:tetratricopeptide (TPR) repeat protein